MLKPALWLLCVLALWAALEASRAWLSSDHGLNAELFLDGGSTGGATGGPPALSSVSPDVSLRRLLNQRPGPPPTHFSVRWFGYLTVLRGDTYTFTLSSDDGSRLSIDGALVVDNGGVHGVEARSGRVRLERGSHYVLVEYFQAGGNSHMEWTWARGGGAPAPVPRWALSTRRTSAAAVLTAAVVDRLRSASIVMLALALGWIAWTTRAMPRHPRAATLALFVGLAILNTWPLATDPAHLSRNDNADTVLNEWAIAWVAHQAIHAPLALFHGNIFHPERYTLAYSEPLIVQGVMAAPLFWLGASPVLAYNLVLIAGFALTAWTTSLVVARWTGDWVAGVTSGIVVGFNAHTLTRVPHLQAQHAEFLPLALFALDALLREPRLRHALQLAGWFALQALTSIHFLVFTALSLTAATLARPEAWFGRRVRTLAPYLVGSVALTALLLVPMLLPYWHLYRDAELSRSLSDVAMYSATWRDYLMTPGRLHYRLWSYRFASGTALFPGIAALLLAGLTIWSGAAFRDRRARMCLALGVAGILLSFGTHLPGYALLYRFLPILQAIRGVVRFGYLGIVAVGILAGFGVVELRRRLPARMWVPAAGLVLALVTLEPFAAPLGLSRFSPVSPLYSRLRSEPHAIVVEFPFYSPRSAFGNARYMLNSTANWKPLLNGYSGFLPRSYFRNFDRLRSFPAPGAIEELRRQRVTHVFVRGRPNVAPAPTLADGLTLIASDGPVALYRLAESP
jgi:hypothetical protein